MVAFPRHSVAWKLEDVPALRRLSLSLPVYGLVVGIIARAYRWLVLAVVAPASLPGILVTITLGVALICAFAAGHFANYTLRSWRWRAPALGACIALGESLTSLALTAVGQERVGRAAATFADWPGTLVSTAGTRIVVVSLFAAVLAAVVTGLRKADDAVGSPGTGGE